MEQLIEITAVVIAGLAALLSYFSSREARIAAQRSAEIANSNAETANLIAKAANAISDTANSIAKKELNVSSKDFKLQYHNEVRVWASRVLGCVGELIALYYRDSAENEKDAVMVISNLSSLTDEGRWFFPNRLQRRCAGKGARDDVLNTLVSIFNVAIETNFQNSKQDKEKTTHLKNLRREFTDQIQIYIQSEEWKVVVDNIDKTKETQ